MRKILRLTESELQGIIDESAKRLVKEQIDSRREVNLAYKELQQMGKHLSSLGLRLDGTPYKNLYMEMKKAMSALNNAMLKELRGK